MAIESSATEWHKELISFSRNGLTASDICCKTPQHIEFATFKDDKKNLRKRRAQCDARIAQMRPLFVEQPQFEKICKIRDNFFVDSLCKTYILKDEYDDIHDKNCNNTCIDSLRNPYISKVKYIYEDSDTDEDSDMDEDSGMDELHEKVIDLKYMINLCGYNLTKLDVHAYPFSEIMPLINNNCPNLEILLLAFKEIKSQDFENVFSNISHLKSLSIDWQCEDSNIPNTLAKSFNQAGGTLEHFDLECSSKKNVFCLSLQLATAFLGFDVLKTLRIHGFEPSELLIGAIGLMENLVNLSFIFSWKKHQMIPKKIDMYQIGYLEKLELLNIDIDSGVTDEFLINLSNHARKLRYLFIIDTYITDKGIDALKNLKGLNKLYLDKLQFDYKGRKIISIQ